MPKCRSCNAKVASVLLHGHTLYNAWAWYIRYFSAWGRSFNSSSYLHRFANCKQFSLESFTNCNMLKQLSFNPFQNFDTSKIEQDYGIAHQLLVWAFLVDWWESSLGKDLLKCDHDTCKQSFLSCISQPFIFYTPWQRMGRYNGAKIHNLKDMKFTVGFIVGKPNNHLT